jgi:hypothetical protein
MAHAIRCDLCTHQRLYSSTTEAEKGLLLKPAGLRETEQAEVIAGTLLNKTEMMPE